MKQQLDTLFGFGWPIVGWLVGSLCIPITILPWILTRFFGKMRERRLKKVLQDKVVLITGASSGLGEALAHAFYCSGCRVVLAARRVSELERVRETLLTTHTNVTTHPPVILPLDLSDINSIPGHVAKVLSIFGHIDILVNNAGVSYRGTVATTSIDVDIKLMLVNYFGQVALTKAVLPSMIERHSGHIVAISSVQGRFAIPYRSAYAASKHALQAFCDTARAELADHNIKVSVISPGYIRTSLSVNAMTGSGKAYGVMDSTTAGGYAPAYVANQVLQAIADEKNEVILSPVSPRLAILIRTLTPSLYFWLMENRARRQNKEIST
ncbi:dehydrogenase/reductase SDR family protein 7-like [Anabrus simplex]|uniref:dehydrogenase/reductase SDR family protein 7-like n=1 Tax=Anabrus simplex TaxID=316456 RepID=UPI0035A37438